MRRRRERVVDPDVRPVRATERGPFAHREGAAGLHPHGGYDLEPRIHVRTQVGLRSPALGRLGRVGGLAGRGGALGAA